jgi:hypothetical protein
MLLGLNGKQSATLNNAMRHGALENDAINGTWDTTRYTNLQIILLGDRTEYPDIEASLSGGSQDTQFCLPLWFNYCRYRKHDARRVV